ncbi:MAG: putative prolin-rich exported protein, partial [Massilia sp.]|nr:putative prolin-rich exported protein [Massilia sp.]
MARGYADVPKCISFRCMIAYAVRTANSERGPMNQHPSFKRIAVAGLGAAMLAAAAPALADPPSRIARLAYISGPVSFAPAGENDWESAALNSTLIAGDRLWVDAGARDEVQVGGAVLRMGGGTLVTLADVDDRLTRLQVSQGRLNIRVRRVAPNEAFEIDTPNLALTIRQPGDYRIDVDPAGNVTTVAVRRGQADAYGGGNAYRLGNGQAYSFGGSDLRDAQLARAGLDEFDRWSATRDRRLEQSRTARYVSPNLVGYEDLDEQGTWRSVPTYGNVWMPANVGRDWAPYRDGHWSYVQPWGWTWVDDAPWGFAVSHYGRWARFPQGWGWVPGPRAASPVYAPALVAFVSIGAGAYAQRERPVAWVPLAPREVYRPSYRASPSYVTNINITNTTLARNQIPRDNQRIDYANRRVGGAVTAVPQAAFTRAQPVSKSALALPMAAVAGAALANAVPPAPERGAMRGRGNGGHQPPPAVVARQAQATAA